MITQSTAAALLLTFVALPIWAQNRSDAAAAIEQIGVRDINRGQINFMSEEKEIESGRMVSRIFEQQTKFVDDPEVIAYVTRLVDRLARNSDARLPIMIKLIESSELNARTLPGGFIYLNSGVLTAADNEAEFAFVIAQQIGHVAARHAAEMSTKAQLVNVASRPLFGGVDRQFTFRGGVGPLTAGTFHAFSRKATAEADLLGVQYLFKAGYDPRAAVTLFQKVQALEPAKPQTSSFDTHPSTENRIESIQEQIEKALPARTENVLTTSEFPLIKSRLTR